MTAWERYDGACYRAVDIVRDMRRVAGRAASEQNWMELKSIGETMQDIAETMIRLQREYEEVMRGASDHLEAVAHQEG